MLRLRVLLVASELLRLGAFPTQQALIFVSLLQGLHFFHRDLALQLADGRECFPHLSLDGALVRFGFLL